MKKIILALAVALAFSAPGLADEVTTGGGVGDVNVGSLGDAMHVTKITITNGNSAAATYYLREYATVATGTILYRMTVPATTVSSFDLSDIEAYGTNVADDGAAATKTGVKGISCPGGCTLDAVTSSTSTQVNVRWK